MMIWPLIDITLALLRTHLGRQLGPAPHTHIVAGPRPDLTDAPTPLIAIHPGKVEMQTQPARPRKPHRQTTTERLHIDPARPQGPYLPSHVPLKGSVRAMLLLAEATAGERHIHLEAGRDFVHDEAQGTLSLSGARTQALLAQRRTQRHPRLPDVLLLEYAFAEISTRLPFEQTLWVEVHDPDPMAAERWASVVTGLILTHHDHLTRRSKVIHEASPHLSTTHAITRIQLLESLPSFSGTLHSHLLTFSVSGLVDAVRAVTEDAIVPRRRPDPDPGLRELVGVDVQVKVA